MASVPVGGYYPGALGTPKDIDIGDTARFAIGELDVTLD